MNGINSPSQPYDLQTGMVSITTDALQGAPQYTRGIALPNFDSVFLNSKDALRYISDAVKDSNLSVGFSLIEKARLLSPLPRWFYLEEEMSQLFCEIAKSVDANITDDEKKAMLNTLAPFVDANHFDSSLPETEENRATTLFYAVTNEATDAIEEFCLLGGDLFCKVKSPKLKTIYSFMQKSLKSEDFEAIMSSYTKYDIEQDETVDLLCGLIHVLPDTALSLYKRCVENSPAWWDLPGNKELLFIAAGEAKHKEIAASLATSIDVNFREKAEWEKFPPNEMPPVVIAARNGWFDVVTTLVNRQADLGVIYNGKTALEWVVAGCAAENLNAVLDLISQALQENITLVSNHNIPSENSVRLKKLKTVLEHIVTTNQKEAFLWLLNEFALGDNSIITTDEELMRSIYECALAKKMAKFTQLLRIKITFTPTSMNAALCHSMKQDALWLWESCNDIAHVKNVSWNTASTELFEYLAQSVWLQDEKKVIFLLLILRNEERTKDAFSILSQRLLSKKEFSKIDSDSLEYIVQELDTINPDWWQNAEDLKTELFFFAAEEKNDSLAARLVDGNCSLTKRNKNGDNAIEKAFINGLERTIVQCVQRCAPISKKAWKNLPSFSNEFVTELWKEFCSRMNSIECCNFISAAFVNKKSDLAVTFLKEVYSCNPKPTWLEEKSDLLSQLFCDICTSIEQMDSEEHENAVIPYLVALAPYVTPSYHSYVEDEENDDEGEITALSKVINLQLDTVIQALCKNDLYALTACLEDSDEPLIVGVNDETIQAIFDTWDVENEKTGNILHDLIKYGEDFNKCKKLAIQLYDKIIQKSPVPTWWHAEGVKESLLHESITCKNQKLAVRFEKSVNANYLGSNIYEGYSDLMPYPIISSCLNQMPEVAQILFRNKADLSLEWQKTERAPKKTCFEYVAEAFLDDLDFMKAVLKKCPISRLKQYHTIYTHVKKENMSKAITLLKKLPVEQEIPEYERQYCTKIFETAARLKDYECALHVREKVKASHQHAILAINAEWNVTASRFLSGMDLFNIQHFIHEFGPEQLQNFIKECPSFDTFGYQLFFQLSRKDSAFHDAFIESAKKLIASDQYVKIVEFLSLSHSKEQFEEIYALLRSKLKKLAADSSKSDLLSQAVRLSCSQKIIEEIAVTGINLFHLVGGTTTYLFEKFGNNLSNLIKKIPIKKLFEPLMLLGGLLRKNKKAEALLLFNKIKRSAICKSKNGVTDLFYTVVQHNEASMAKQLMDKIDLQPNQTNHLSPLSVACAMPASKDMQSIVETLIERGSKFFTAPTPYKFTIFEQLARAYPTIAERILSEMPLDSTFMELYGLLFFKKEHQKLGEIWCKRFLDSGRITSLIDSALVKDLPALIDVLAWSKKEKEVEYAFNRFMTAAANGKCATVFRLSLLKMFAMALQRPQWHDKITQLAKLWLPIIPDVISHIESIGEQFTLNFIEKMPLDNSEEIMALLPFLVQRNIKYKTILMRRLEDAQNAPQWAKTPVKIATWLSFRERLEPDHIHRLFACSNAEVINNEKLSFHFLKLFDRNYPEHVEAWLDKIFDINPQWFQFSKIMYVCALLRNNVVLIDKFVQYLMKHPDRFNPEMVVSTFIENDQIFSCKKFLNCVYEAGQIQPILNHILLTPKIATRLLGFLLEKRLFKEADFVYERIEKLGFCQPHRDPWETPDFTKAALVHTILDCPNWDEDGTKILFLVQQGAQLATPLVDVGAVFERIIALYGEEFAIEAVLKTPLTNCLQAKVLFNYFLKHKYKKFAHIVLERLFSEPWINNPVEALDFFLSALEFDKTGLMPLKLVEKIASNSPSNDPKKSPLLALLSPTLPREFVMRKKGVVEGNIKELNYSLSPIHEKLVRKLLAKGAMLSSKDSKGVSTFSYLYKQFPHVAEDAITVLPLNDSPGILFTTLLDENFYDAARKLLLRVSSNKARFSAFLNSIPMQFKNVQFLLSRFELFGYEREAKQVFQQFLSELTRLPNTMDTTNFWKARLLHLIVDKKSWVNEVESLACMGADLSYKTSSNALITQIEGTFGEEFTAALLKKIPLPPEMQTVNLVSELIKCKKKSLYKILFNRLTDAKSASSWLSNPEFSLHLFVQAVFANELAVAEVLIDTMSLSTQIFQQVAENVGKYISVLMFVAESSLPIEVKTNFIRKLLKRKASLTDVDSEDVSAFYYIHQYLPQLAQEIISENSMKEDASNLLSILARKEIFSGYLETLFSQLYVPETDVPRWWNGYSKAQLFMQVAPFAKTRPIAKNIAEVLIQDPKLDLLARNESSQTVTMVALECNFDTADTKKLVERESSNGLLRLDGKGKPTFAYLYEKKKNDSELAPKIQEFLERLSLNSIAYAEPGTKLAFHENIMRALLLHDEKWLNANFVPLSFVEKYKAIEFVTSQARLTEDYRDILLNYSFQINTKHYEDSLLPAIPERKTATTLKSLIALHEQYIKQPEELPDIQTFITKMTSKYAIGAPSGETARDAFYKGLENQFLLLIDCFYQELRQPTLASSVEEAHAFLRSFFKGIIAASGKCGTAFQDCARTHYMKLVLKQKYDLRRRFLYALADFRETLGQQGLPVDPQSMHAWKGVLEEYGTKLGLPGAIEAKQFKDVHAQGHENQIVHAYLYLVKNYTPAAIISFISHALKGDGNGAVWEEYIKTFESPIMQQFDAYNVEEILKTVRPIIQSTTKTKQEKRQEIADIFTQDPWYFSINDSDDLTDEAVIKKLLHDVENVNVHAPHNSLPPASGNLLCRDASWRAAGYPHSASLLASSPEAREAPSSSEREHLLENRYRIRSKISKKILNKEDNIKEDNIFEYTWAMVALVLQSMSILE